MMDSDARVRAVTTYDRNLIIVAGAGTGKTSLLIERVLNQVVEQNVELRELAAITFTEKAATELRNRLEAGLAELVELACEKRSRDSLDERKESHRAYAYLAQRVAGEQIEERAGRALHELPRARISTIHAFCARILRAYPVEAGVDPSFSVDEGLTLAALLEELWEEFLEDEQGPGGRQRDQWGALLRFLDLHELRRIAFQLGDFSLPFQPSEPSLPAATTVLAPCVEALCQRISALIEEGREPTKGPESYLDVTRRLLETLLIDGLPRFREALASARYEAHKGPKGVLEGSPPTAKASPEATECAREARKLLDQLHTIDDELCARALERVATFAQRAREEARRRGVLSFDALLSLTRDLLARDSKVRRRLAAEYRVLLVDEFQDTDPLQYEIILFLAEELDGNPSDDPYATRLAAGKLFIVGDPKQSIYHFRRADIAAYHRAVAHIEACGGQQLPLTTSWRAVQNVLEPLNPLFAALLEPRTESERDIEPGYETMASGRGTADDGPRVELWTVGGVGNPQNAERAREAEGEAIADWIARECHADRQAFGEFAILLRALSQVNLYTRPLRERGIPFAVESRRDPLSHPEGLELHALLRALANPNDAPAVLGVLRSPLVATPDLELLHFAQTGTGWCYPGSKPDPRRFPNIARGFAFLQHWYEYALLQPPDVLLGRLLEDTPLLTLHAAAEDGGQRIRVLRALTDRLAEIAHADPERTLASLLPWLESDNALPSGETEGGRVRILSVHGAKGLEFPTVLLPDLDRGSGGKDRRATGNVSVAWLPRLRALAMHTPAGHSASWLRHSWEEERHERAEHKRLFYVACTRAMERLILVHAPRRRPERQAWVGFLSEWGYPASGLEREGRLEQAAGVQHRVVQPEAALRAQEVPRETRDWADIVRRTRETVEDASRRAVPGFRSPSGLREETDAAREAAPGKEGPAAPAGSDLARLVGLAVHEALERWDFRDPDALAAGLARAVSLCVRDSAIEPAAVQEEASAVLEGLLASQLPGYLASREILGRELPLLVEDEQGIPWSGTLDLLYREPDGGLVVADYKTDRAPGPETNERYRAQLDIYAQAIARAFPEAPAPARELIYVRTGKRVRVGYNQAE